MDREPTAAASQTRQPVAGSLGRQEGCRAARPEASLPSLRRSPVPRALTTLLGRCRASGQDRPWSWRMGGEATRHVCLLSTKGTQEGTLGRAPAAGS